MRAGSGNQGSPPLCCSVPKQTPKVNCFVRVDLIELDAIDQDNLRCGAMPRESRQLSEQSRPVRFGEG